MKADISNLTYDENGFIPAIVQDDTTRKVLMLAYTNEASLTRTIETKETWFFSRPRQALWNKGATSGNRQKLQSISYDCDQDTLLIQVDPGGPACHTGETTCFYQTIYDDNKTPKREVNQQLAANNKKRRPHPVEGCYTQLLCQSGT